MPTVANAQVIRDICFRAADQPVSQAHCICAKGNDVGVEQTCLCHALCRQGCGCCSAAGLRLTPRWPLLPHSMSQSRAPQVTYAQQESVCGAHLDVGKDQAPACKHHACDLALVCRHWAQLREPHTLTLLLFCAQALAATPSACSLTQRRKR